MNLEKTTIQNSPHIGLFCLASDNFVLHPPNLGKQDLQKLSLLSKNLFSFTISGTSILSIFSIANNKGIVLNKLAEKTELSFLKENNIDFLQLDTLKTIGNFCSINNTRGLISPELSEFKKDIESFLNIELRETKIAGSSLTGSLSVLSDKGAVVSPKISDKELNEISSFLKISVVPTTINYGDSFPASGILANNNAVLVGSETSSLELAKLHDAFGGN